MATDNWIAANWPAPERIRAGTTTREGGVSTEPYDSFNLAAHVGDDLGHVDSNRSMLMRQLTLPTTPLWLKQEHGNSVIHAPGAATAGTCADACYTSVTGVVCVVLTADCIPLLMCNRAGTLVAALHAGWRGICRGIIGNCVAQLNEHPDQLLAWVGPCICAAHYPVREDMRNACLQALGTAAGIAFTPAPQGGWFADIEKLAIMELKRLGMSAIYSSSHCTYAESDRFYSYRRDGRTGRMASLIWIADQARKQT